MRVTAFRLPTPARALRRVSCGATLATEHPDDEYDVCAVAVAGAVAEIRHFGTARGGVDDFERAFRAAGTWSVVYWGVLAADFLLAEHQVALEALVAAIMRGEQSLPALLHIVDSTLDLS
ncbi:unnamed protein product [Agarophyton chilense]